MVLLLEADRPELAAADGSHSYQRQSGSLEGMRVRDRAQLIPLDTSLRWSGAILRELYRGIMQLRIAPRNGLRGLR